ncbi:MAG TPA: pyridoxal-phosphate dependent enzyme [Polyangiaceae bacterium]
MKGRPIAIRRALFQVWPKLARELPWAELGDFPTPVSPLDGLARALDMPELELYEKRDDVSSAVYGGNKVRTLEVLLGQARDRGCGHVFATGAFGSNHAVATALHAPRLGLSAGAVLFPQPRSWAALENLRAVLSTGVPLRALGHWSLLPFGMAMTSISQKRRGHRPFIMVPGGATPLGALGYVSAAFELAEQVEARVLPRPEQVIIGVGSTCTSAGLLVGFAHAARLGIGFRDARGRPYPPELLSVRVTPWPVTSKARIVSLAVRTSQLLAKLCGEPALVLDRAALGRHIHVSGEFLGRGYGQATADGRRAVKLWHEHVGHELDTTYSAKSAAALVLRAERRRPGPALLWATKSSVPLPPVNITAIRAAPKLALRWMERAERELLSSHELPAGYEPASRALTSSA